MLTRLRSLLFLGLGLCFSSQSTFADWTDNFDGGFQQTWDFGNLNGDLDAPSGSFVAEVDNDTLLLADPTSAASGGAALGFGFVNEVFDKVMVSGILNPNGQTDLNAFYGLAARADFSTLSGYVLSYDQSSGDIDLIRAVEGVQTGLASGNIGIIDDSIYAELIAVGDSLTGRFFDAPGGSLLEELSGSDSLFSTGVAGVVVQVDQGSNASVTAPLTGRWDSISAVAVPEPGSTLALSLLGTAIVAGRRFRKPHAAS